MLARLGKSMKDGALAVALKAYVNDKFAEYGEVLECQVDTHKSRLTVLARMKGEKDTVSATLEQYELQQEGDKLYIVLQRFSTSRAWLTLLLNKLFSGKRYALPPTVGKLL